MRRRDPAVVIDQRLHGPGEMDDLDRALDAVPLPEEALAEHADRGLGVAQQLADLDPVLAGADDHPALVVDAGDHRGELGASIAALRGDHGAWVVPGAVSS